MTKTEDTNLKNKDGVITDERVETSVITNDENKEQVDAQETDETKETDAEAEVLDTEKESDEESDDSENQEENEDTTDKLEVKASYDAKTKVAVASTAVVDRHGESINQEGWDLKSFKSNPVMLWAHDHSEISVGNARNIHIEKKSGTPRLVFTPDFHDKTPTAKALKELFEEGWLNSFSVGFIPKDFDGKTSTYLKQELLEISAVNVPANPDARMMSYKSLVKKGFEKDVAEEVTGITSEDKQSLVDIMKGALADEIAENEQMEKKYKRMSAVHDVYWAFCDVYYDEETDVDDFEKLVGELITELGKITNSSADDDTEEPMEESVVLDNNSDKSETDNKTAETEEESAQAKVPENKETATAPTGDEKQARAKQQLSKVIAKASEKLLDAEKTGGTSEDKTQYIKVIKRAAEILNQSHKSK